MPPMSTAMTAFSSTCQAGPLRMDPDHAANKVLGAKGKRSHDDGVGPAGAVPGRCVANAAIDGKQSIAAGFAIMPRASRSLSSRVQPDTLDPILVPRSVSIARLPRWIGRMLRRVEAAQTGRDALAPILSRPSRRRHSRHEWK